MSTRSTIWCTEKDFLHLYHELIDDTCRLEIEFLGNHIIRMPRWVPFLYKCPKLK